MNPPSLGPNKDVEMDRARANLVNDKQSLDQIKKEADHIKRHLLQRRGKYITKYHAAVFDQFEVFMEDDGSNCDPSNDSEIERDYEKYSSDGK